MEILVVGGGCASCDTVYEETRATAVELGLDAKIRKVEDLVEMVQMGIMTVPALVVDGKVLSAGRTLNKKQVKALLEKVL